MLASTFNQATLDELLGIEMDDHPVFRTIFGSSEIAFAMAEWDVASGWIDPNVRAGSPRRKAPRATTRTGASTTGFATGSQFAGAGGFGASRSGWSNELVEA